MDVCNGACALTKSDKRQFFFITYFAANLILLRVEIIVIVKGDLRRRTCFEIRYLFHFLLVLLIIFMGIKI